MKKHLSLFIMTCFMIAAAFVMNTQSVSAATPKVVTIQTGEGDDRGLSNYDIDGDGNKDTLKVFDGGYGYYDEETGEYIDEDYGENGWVTLNGETVLRFRIDDEYYFYGAKLIVLKNGRKFLLLDYNYSEYKGIYSLYQYKNGNFQEIAYLNEPLNDFRNKYGIMTTLSSVKVSGNTVSVYEKYYSWTFGNSIIKYNFVYKNGTLVRSPKSGMIYKVTQKKSGKCFSSKTFITKRAIKAYKSVKSNKKYMTIAKGKKVSLESIYSSDKYGVWIRVKYAGKHMWIKALKGSSKDYFKYVYCTYGED